MKLSKQQANLKFLECGSAPKNSKKAIPGNMRMGRQRLCCVFGIDFQNTSLQESSHIKIVDKIL